MKKKNEISFLLKEAYLSTVSDICYLISSSCTSLSRAKNDMAYNPEIPTKAYIILVVIVIVPNRAATRS